MQPQKFLAGRYPTLYDNKDPSIRFEHYIKSGITCFIDLTEKGEMPAYEKAIKKVSKKLLIPAAYHRFPIKDFGIPNVRQMKRILKTINETLQKGQVVYLHCYMGVGRTGTVVGCYLVEKGFIKKDALEEINRLRKGTDFAFMDSPQTKEQIDFIINWDDQI